MVQTTITDMIKKFFKIKLRLINNFFLCQHKWRDVVPYKPTSEIAPLDDSIPQIVNEIHPTHYCTKCKIALIHFTVNKRI